MWSVSQLASKVRPQIAHLKPYLAATRRAWKGVILFRCIGCTARVVAPGRALGARALGVLSSQPEGAVRVELVAVCNGARGVGRVGASTGSSSARPTTLEANTFQARVRSTPGPRRETRRHAANMKSRGTQFGNRRILFIEGHRQQRPWRRQTPLRCARAGDGFAGVFGSGVKVAFRRSPTGHLDPSRETRAGAARPCAGA